MKKEEIYKIAPYVEEHYKRCWVEGYIACLQAKDPTLADIAEKYAEKLDISKGWFDGCEIDELIKESYKAGAGWQKEKVLSLIESRLSQIMGDAQPRPALRAELRDLIDLIKG